MLADAMEQGGYDARLREVLKPVANGETLADFGTAAAVIKPAHGGLEARLAAHGLQGKRALFAAAAQQLLDGGVDGSAAVAAFWVPGRVELLGKHTDYVGGRSLLAATNRGFAVVSADRADPTLRVFAKGSVATISLAKADAAAALPAEDWALYPATAARRLVKNFGLEHGCDLSVGCDLPEASGMSSSSAIICLTFLALAKRNQLAARPEFAASFPTPEVLCHYLGCCENGQSCGALPGDKGVGTFGGSEDHTAIMCCGAGQARQYAFCPTRLERVVDFSPELKLIIAVSGAEAHKGGDKLADYNNASLLARWAAHAAGGAAAAAEAAAAGGSLTLATVVRAEAEKLQLPTDDPKVRDAVAALIAASDDGQYGPSGPTTGGAAGFAPGALAQRFAQFWEESEVLLPKAAACLDTGGGGGVDPEIGALVDRSHANTVGLLKNTVAETEWLPGAAREKGALAASAFGAGYGGSCWALATAERAEALCAEWQRAYLAQFPSREGKASFFVMAPSTGACLL